MKRYSHGLTIAFYADSDDPAMPTAQEALAGLLKRVADIASDPQETAEALLSETPFATEDHLAFLHTEVTA